MNYYTFQDFEAAADKVKFLQTAIAQYRSSDAYRFALEADEYYAQRNTAILENTKKLYSMTGAAVPDFTASNIQISSNFLRRLVTQRLTYSLGNGVNFTETKTKKAVGDDFDTFVFELSKKALLHGVSYGFWNHDRGHVFPMTEFMPLLDETDGTLRAGARFWSLDWDRKPVTVVLYEEDGYTTYRTKPKRTGLNLEEVEPKRAYIQIVQHSDADGDTVIGETNYSGLPVVPMWGNSIHESVLSGIKSMIDAYDLINSGLANDINDCAQIYWIIGNASGMRQDELLKFRDQLKFLHIAVADTDNSSVRPYTQDVPVAGRRDCLTELRTLIYESFGALDVHAVAAGATNDHIDAAYQPMDEEADDFEYQVIKFVRQVLVLMGLDDMPTFKRNRISNQREQVDMIVLEAPYLDTETILNKLPNITVDEVPEIMARRAREEVGRFTAESEAQPADPRQYAQNGLQEASSAEVI